MSITNNSCSVIGKRWSMVSLRVLKLFTCKKIAWATVAAGDDSQRDVALRMDAKQDSLSKSQSISMEKFNYHMEYRHNRTINTWKQN